MPRSPRLRATASVTILAVVASLMLGATSAAADEAPVDAPVEAVVETPAPVAPAPSTAPVAPVVETPAPAPAVPDAPALPTPTAEPTGPDSVTLTWPATDTVDPTALDVLVFLGDSKTEAELVEVADPKQKSVVVLEKLDKGATGIEVEGLEPGTAYEFVVRTHATPKQESDRTESVRTLDAGAAPVAVGTAPVAGRVESSVAAAAASTAPIVTVRGGTAVSVDVSAFATASAGTEGAFFSVTATSVAGAAPVKMAAVISANTALITGLTPGTEYTVTATEGNTSAESDPSAVFITNAEATAPGVTSAVPTTEVTGSSTILVSWPAVDTGADVRSYTARAYNAAGAVVSTKTGLDPFTNGTSWEFVNLLSNTEYSFTVTAIGYDLPGAESGRSAAVFTKRGLPGAPAGAVLSRPSLQSTDVTATWTAPVNDGGYPITAYTLRFYNTGGSASTANLVKTVDVPATSTSYAWTDSWIVGGTLSVQVVAQNAAGTSAASTHSPNHTNAVTLLPALATVTTASMLLSEPTAEGFTLKWNAVAGASATTGYTVRVVEQLPSNPAATSNYTAAVRDLGTGHPTTGTLTAAITGLEGGRVYRVSITPYNKAGDGTVTFRASSARSSVTTGTVKTLGSGMPAQPIAKAATPVVLGVDSVSWTGAALTEAYWGGSPLTGYSISLYADGALVPVQTVTAPEPSHTFTGLERSTFYQVRYAGINANGTGALSELSLGVATLAKPAPGSVAPRYSTVAELEAGIAGGLVATVSAVTLGLADLLESNGEVAFAAAVTSTDSAGELWLYPAATGPDYQGEFAIEAGIAAVDFTLDDLATGDYWLVLFSETGTPLAVKLAITKPITGPTALDDAIFRWGINNESNNGSFFGGCNFLSAGKAPSAGSSKLFTSGQYAAEGSGVDANVRVEKPNARGDYQLASWGTKCLTRTGAPVTSSVNSAFTDSQVVITGGTGTVDPSTNSGTIQWAGSFTVAYYGGLTYWYATNPKLTLVNGVGTLTATASGYGTDMFDPSKWVELASREITLANLSDVKLTSKGLSALPAYLGVVADTSGGSHQPQVAKDATNAGYWGSFGSDFIEFQAETGQLAYWYSSGGTQDPAKPALPLHVGYDAENYEDPDSGDGEGDGESTTPPKVSKPPVQQQPLRVSLASPTETSVDGLAALLRMIEEGTVTQLPASKAGLPRTFAIGDRLDFDFAWTGDDTKGVIWLYPGVSYAGTFSVVDGRVVVALDSSVLEKAGEIYFTFFGDEGTVITISSEATPAVAADDEAAVTMDAPAPAAAALSPVAAPVVSPVLLAILIGGIAVLLLAGGGAALVLRRPKTPVLPG